MDEVVYIDSFIQEAQKLLRKMLEKNLEEISFEKPFENMKVVIGRPQNKSVIAIINIPKDLMEKISNKKVYVVI